jgi:predicted MFS family arabinose efflux permease
MPTSDRYAKKVLVLVFCVSLFNYIDRQMLYAVFPLIKKDLLLSDARLGFLASSFMMVYMCVAPLIAYFGDRYARPAVIGVSAVFWSLATVLTGMVRTYPQLVLSRAAVGVGEAGYGTVSPAYLAEWFPEGSRARVMALYALAIPVGSAAGYLLGGVLGQYFGWRAAFFIVAVPGILLGAAVWTLRETGEKTARPAEVVRPGRYLELFRNRTYLLVSFSQAIATFSVGGLAAWMPSYFVRNFNMSLARAGLAFGAVTVLSGVAGNLSGGWLADWLRRRTKRAYFIVGYMGFFLSVPFGVLTLLANTPGAAFAALFMAEFFIFAHYGPYHAAVVEIIPVNRRSMAFALNIFIMHAFGDALSPMLIGMVSDAWGLTLAVLMAASALLLGGVTSIFAGHYYQRDFQPEAA